MIEGVLAIANKIGYKTEIVDALENGKKLKTVIIHHGPHPVFAIERGSYVQLVVILDIDPKDAELLEKRPEIDKVVTILKASMLQGRSGYAMHMDGKKIKRITIEQRLVVAPNRQESIQRLLDGIQELVVLGVRCGMILGEAFSNATDSARTSSPPPPPDGMYA